MFNAPIVREGLVGFVSVARRLQMQSRVQMMAEYAGCCWSAPLPQPAYWPAAKVQRLYENDASYEDGYVTVDTNGIVRLTHPS